MAYLVLVRHGQSEWNKIGRWQGLTDIPLSEEGRKQSRAAARALQDIKIDAVYTSGLSRVTQTYDEIQKELKLSCPVVQATALNERDYGIYTGKNKWEVKEQLGEKEFLNLRRGWNYPIPQGESLADVYNRVVPFYKEKILKDLKKGKNVLVVSSGNTLRALVKYLDNISDEDVAKLEIPTGQVLVYSIDQQ